MLGRVNPVIARVCPGLQPPMLSHVCFLSHNANFGCSKCFKSFSTGKIGVMDYSGFDRNSWKVCTNVEHRKSVDIILKAKKKAEKGKLESLHGCHFSVLLHLPYFDPVSMFSNTKCVMLMDPQTMTKINKPCHEMHQNLLLCYFIERKLHI